MSRSIVSGMLFFLSIFVMRYSLAFGLVIGATAAMLTMKGRKDVH